MIHIEKTSENQNKMVYCIEDNNISPIAREAIEWQKKLERQAEELLTLSLYIEHKLHTEANIK